MRNKGGVFLLIGIFMYIFLFNSDLVGVVFFFIWGIKI